MDDRPSSAWFWYFIGIVALIGVALVMLGTGTAKAQQQCPQLSALVDELGEKYSEQVIWGGTAAQGAVRFMLFQSQTGTWTLVQVQGVQACPIAAGQEGTAPKAAPMEQPGEAT